MRPGKGDVGNLAAGGFLFRKFAVGFAGRFRVGVVHQKIL